MDKNYVYVVKLSCDRPELKNKSGRQGYHINIGVASTIEAAKKIGENYFRNDPKIKELLEQDDKFVSERENINVFPLVVYKKFYGINRDKMMSSERWYMSYEVQQFELQ